MEERQDGGSMLDLLPGGVLRYSPEDGSIDYFNSKLAEMLGYTAEQFTQRFSDGFWSLVFNIDSESLLAEKQRMLDEKGESVNEYYVECFDGTLIKVRDNSRIVTDANGARRVYAVLTKLKEESETERYMRRTMFSILNNLAVGLAIYDVADGMVTPSFISPRACSILRTTRGGHRAMLRDGQLSYIGDPETFIRDRLPAMLKSDMPEHCMFKMEMEDEREIWIHANTLTTVSGEKTRLYTTLTDVTDEIETQLIEKRQSERYRLISECSDAINFEYITKTDTLEYNVRNPDGSRRIITVENYRRDMAQSRIIHRDCIRTVKAVFTEMLSGQDRMAIEYQANIRGDGYRWLRAYLVSVRNDVGDVYSIVGRLEDIQEERDRDRMRADLEAALRKKAETDALTGIYNKSTAQDKIRCRLAEQATGEHSALMIVDIDDFKRINDTNGHYYGDVFLKEAAAVIKKTFREEDIIGRFGGDEFVIFIAEHADKRLAERKAKQILKGFNRIEVPGIELASCSIGAVIIGSDMTDYDTAFKRADTALYESKRQGKNCFNVYSRSLRLADEGTVEHTALDLSIRHDHSGDNLSSMIFTLLFSSADTDEAIKAMLETVGRSAGASRAYLCDGDTGEKCHLVYEWTADGVPSMRNKYFVRTPKHLIDDLKNNDFFYCRNSPRDGVASALYCTLRDNSRFMGFIAFDQCRPDVFWNQEQVETFCFVASITGAYLQKQRIKEREDRHFASLREAISSCSLPIVMVDCDTMKVNQMSKRAVRLLGNCMDKPCRGLLCPDGSANECERCILTRAAAGDHACCQNIDGVPATAELIYSRDVAEVCVIFGLTDGGEPQ